ncbi:MAG: helix-turn-helix domain-containing protein [Bacteroidales bacterium]|nr:helix-turn-helix domain-containing protein [Bacteroidales bacterium]MBN2749857.1 helix-turn-helix domain-containing protein [Bacteroidales bacterium]
MTSSPSFSIFSLNKLNRLHTGDAAKPHSHGYYTILVIEQGQGKYAVDFVEYELGNSMVFFISPGQEHHLLCGQQPQGYRLRFSDHFLTENSIPDCFFADLNLFQDFSSSPPLKLTANQFAQLVEYCVQMERYHSSTQKFKEQAVASLLKLFLITCNGSCSLSFDSPHSQEAGFSVLKRFRDLVEQNIRQWHATSDYARAMSITPDYLNRTVKSLVGKTAKEYLQSKLIIAAKRNLFFTDMSVKEIGYDLGFTEPANFNLFFKKQTGTSPAAFRKSR